MLNFYFFQCCTTLNISRLLIAKESSEISLKYV